MIDLQREYSLVWPKELKPIGEGSLVEKEAFEPWWERNQGRLSHLHPHIAEQWVHRHWNNSPFCHLDLFRISWRLESWATERLLTEVTRPDPIDETALAHDWELYRDRDREPAVSMRAIGTWNIPIIVIEAPNGALRFHGRDDRHYFLIEGHQRMRCLAVFNRFGACAAEHEVFVLTYPEMASEPPPNSS